MKDVEQKLLDFHQSHISNSKSISQFEESIEKLKMTLNEKDNMIKSLESESNQLRSNLTDHKISNEFKLNEMRLQVNLIKKFYVLIREQSILIYELKDKRPRCQFKK
jgi:hypothetical protein